MKLFDILFAKKLNQISSKRTVSVSGMLADIGYDLNVAIPDAQERASLYSAFNAPSQCVCARINVDCTVVGSGSIGGIFGEHTSDSSNYFLGATITYPVDDGNGNLSIDGATQLLVEVGFNSNTSEFFLGSTSIYSNGVETDLSSNTHIIPYSLTITIF